MKFKEPKETTENLLLFQYVWLIALFGSTYVCDQSFLQIKNYKSNKRNRLTDKHLQSVIKIISMKFSPSFPSLSES